MTVIDFPRQNGGLRPIIELYTPDQTGSGQHEVWLWRSDDREDGFIYRVHTMRDAEKLIAAIQAALPGRWKRG